MRSKIRIKSSEKLKKEFHQAIIDLGGRHLIKQYEHTFIRWYKYMENIGGLIVEANRIDCGSDYVWQFKIPKIDKYYFYCDADDVEEIL